MNKFSINDERMMDRWIVDERWVGVRLKIDEL
jgi:hypothetical protein